MTLYSTNFSGVANDTDIQGYEGVLEELSGNSRVWNGITQFQTSGAVHTNRINVDNTPMNHRLIGTGILVGANRRFFLCVGMGTIASPTFYSGGYIAGSGYSIRKHGAASDLGIELASNTGLTHVDGDKWEVRIENNGGNPRITLLVNDVQKLQFTDTNSPHTTGTRAGWNGHTNGSAGTATLNFDNLSAPAPTANAGNDQTVTEGATVNLNGSGSAAAIGQAITAYAWTVTNDGGTGLTTANLTGANTATPSFTFPEVAEAGATVTLQLQVTQTDGQTATDTVNITGQDASSSSTTPMKKVRIDGVWVERPIKTRVGGVWV